MKLKDIEVGKEYANSDEQKVTVLEVGVYGQVDDVRGVGSFESERADYVRVEGPYAKDIIHCRSIVHDWETQEKRDKEKEKESSLGVARVNYLWGVLEKYTEVKRRNCWPETRIDLNHSEVEKVCAAFLSQGTT